MRLDRSPWNSQWHLLASAFVGKIVSANTVEELLEATEDRNVLAAVRNRELRFQSSLCAFKVSSNSLFGSDAFCCCAGALASAATGSSSSSLLVSAKS